MLGRYSEGVSGSDGGVVYLVGAGPGDPALLTRRGADVLRRAQVVVYDGLANAVLLNLAPPECERIYAGKKHAPTGQPPLSQAAINHLLVDRAAAGQRVVRLKGGDPFVFGRGAEECAALADAGLRFEIVPGVTSATAVGAYAGIPLTQRGKSSTVAFATGHEAAGKPDSDVDWQALARAGTCVLFMALRTAADCAKRLIDAGRDPQTPAAAIYWGTTASQRTVTAPLVELPAAIAAAALRPPVLIVVGDVVTSRPTLTWYEQRPLFGARVLITRGVDQARRFSHALSELGAEPVVAPVTRLRPPDAAGVAALGAAFDVLASYDWVVLTSANSVTRFFDELAARSLDARALGNARIACIGPATAAAARERGIFADAVPPRGDATGVAQAVIAAAGETIDGARVLFPRSAQGRDEALHLLRGAGATVDVAPVYSTEGVEADDPSIRYGISLLRANKIDCVAFFAPSQVRALFDLLGDDAATILGGCDIIAAIGNTTGAAIERRGVAVHVVPSSPDPDVMATEIAAYYQTIATESQR